MIGVLSAITDVYLSNKTFSIFKFLDTSIFFNDGFENYTKMMTRGNLTSSQSFHGPRAGPRAEEKN